MGALLALIPPKDWFIGAAFAVLAVMGWHYYDKYKDAVKYADTVKAESAQAEATARATIAELNRSYSASLDNLEASKNAELKAAADKYAADISRLRKLAADRGTDPVLHGANGTAAEADAWAAILARLEQVSGGLAYAVSSDDAQLEECWRERDSLTGK